jgi:hypothetical protein
MATEALRWLKDLRAIPALREAVNHEDVEGVRSQMEHDLNYLLKLTSTSSAPVSR